MILWKKNFFVFFMVTPEGINQVERRFFMFFFCKGGATITIPMQIETQAPTQAPDVAVQCQGFFWANPPNLTFAKNIVMFLLKRGNSQSPMNEGWIRTSSVNDWFSIAKFYYIQEYPTQSITASLPIRLGIPCIIGLYHVISLPTLVTYESYGDPIFKPIYRYAWLISR